jgi:hypothetical protein
MKNAIRWAMVMFACGVSCGIVGHYCTDTSWPVTITSLAIAFAVVGTIGIEREEM